MGPREALPLGAPANEYHWEQMMSSFNARLSLTGESRIILGVLVDVADGTMTVTSAQREIATWTLDEIEVRHLVDGFHIIRGDEEVVLGLTEPVGFASAVGAEKAAREMSPELPVIEGETGDRRDTPAVGGSRLGILNRLAQVS